MFHEGNIYNGTAKNYANIVCLAEYPENAETTKILTSTRKIVIVKC